MGRWQVRVASRNGCPRRGGGGGVDHDPLVGCLQANSRGRILARQLSDGGATVLKKSHLFRLTTDFNG